METNTRKKFFIALRKLAAQDKDIIFLTGDLGYSYMEDFQAEFPDQFINCGCIEQSMIGIAVGLAMAGKKPYVYSTLNFLLFRALEQVRNDVCYMENNVKLIGVSMSGFIGFTHNRLHETEDVALCKNIGLRCYTPGIGEVNDLLIKVNKDKEPVYIRL
jgi:transketolase